jgi:1-acyl-sn-glycerol-3-phosphate acyltransferase
VAAEAGVPVVPFAGIGVEELFENLPGWDAFERSDFARRLEGIVGRRNRPMPPVRGLGPLPKPVKLVFRFGKPMPTDRLDTTDEKAVLAFQRAVRAEVESMIKIGRARWKKGQT